MNPRRAKPTLVFGVLALIMLVVFVLAILALNGQKLKVDSDFKAFDKQCKELQKEVDAKPTARLEEEMRKLEGQLAGVAMEQPEKEYIPAFTRAIQDVGRETGVTFKELRPGEYRKGKNIGTAESGMPTGKYGEYDITLRFSGRFRDVFDTIQQLGQLEQMVCANDIDLKSTAIGGPVTTGPPNVDAVVDLTAFILEGGALPFKLVAGSH